MINEQEQNPNITKGIRLIDVSGSQTISGLGENLDRFVWGIRQHDSEITTYRLFQELAEKIPYHIPEETSQKALQAITSTDPDTRRMGNTVALMLHARTILSATAHLLDKPPEDEAENDDIFHAAILSATEYLSGTRTVVHLSQSIYQASRWGAATYIASRFGLPVNLVDNPLFKPIKDEITSKLEDNNYRLSDPEIDELVNNLHEETKTPEEDLLRIVNSLRFWGSRTRQDIDEVCIQLGEDERVFNEVVSTLLREDLEKALPSLSTRQRFILINYFYNEESEVKVAKKFGITSERVRQIREETLKTLRRYPSRARYLAEYLNPTDRSLISPPSISPRRLKLSPVRLKDAKNVLSIPESLNIQVLGVNSEDYQRLTECGIKFVGDFFAIPFNHIKYRRWSGRPDDLIVLAGKTLDLLSDLYKECLIFELPSKPHLFLHVTNVVLLSYGLDYFPWDFVEGLTNHVAERVKIQEIYKRLDERLPDEKIIPTHSDILMLREDSIERSVRRRIFRRAFDELKAALKNEQNKDS